MKVDFSKRSEETEIMDDLLCSGEVLKQTLRELDVINKRLGGNKISLNGLKHFNLHTNKPTVIADLGCGSGDIMIQMIKWARKTGNQLKCIGIDANPNIIALAQRHCEQYDEISFKTLNIFSDEFKNLEFDIIHSSLFTHHFENADLIKLIKQMYSQSSLGFIINDLHRHFLAYHSIKFLTLLFSRSAMVRNDASVSVARAFSKSDLNSLFSSAGLKNYRVKWQWAFRWQIIHQKLNS